MAEAAEVAEAGLPVAADLVLEAEPPHPATNMTARRADTVSRLLRPIVW